MYVQLPLDYGVPIDADDIGLTAWLLDMEFVDEAVPAREARLLVFDSRELTGIDVLRARLATYHQEN